MRIRPALAALLLMLLATALGCPRTMSPTAARPTPTPVHAVVTSTKTPWRPLPKPIALAAGEVACVSNEDCTALKMVCLSPEQKQWNSCDAPKPTDCGPGWHGDSCGHCLLACREVDACPIGMWCDGTQCHSPARCTAPPPRKP